jgi:histidyl-tRNA synthetase
VAAASYRARSVKGMRDLLPPETAVWARVESIARSVFTRYGFAEIRTPIVEETELFVRGVGEGTDIVGKEMYTFTDQSGRSVTLRPEATASVVRAYVEHHRYRGGGVEKLYYIGPMFRHEKKQKGRWRQFYQIGAEVLGSDNPAIESEVIEMLLSLIASVGVRGHLVVNSVGDANCRPAFVEKLREAILRDLGSYCPDCQRRAVTNPLRVLDCKVPTCQPLIERLPKISESLCDACREHFDQFRSYLDLAGIEFEIVPRLVRGLDYYVRTAFEILSGDLGAQNALAGGGRYDGLSEVIGGPRVAGFGFALGLDRLVMLIPDEVAARATQAPDLFIAYLGEPAFRRALEIARRFRQEGRRVLYGFTRGSLKSQLRQANSVAARTVLIVGEGELASGRYPVRDMAAGTQTEMTLEELGQRLGGQGISAAPALPAHE